VTRRPTWSDKLARPIHIVGGRVLHTRDDARAYMVTLPERRQRQNSWQHAAKLLLEHADAEALTTQIEYAVMLDGDTAWPSAR
jgi:hypothetical protein